MNNSQASAHTNASLSNWGGFLLNFGVYYGYPGHANGLNRPRLRASNLLHQFHAQAWGAIWMELPHNFHHLLSVRPRVSTQCLHQCSSFERKDARQWSTSFLSTWSHHSQGLCSRYRRHKGACDCALCRPTCEFIHWQTTQNKSLRTVLIAFKSSGWTSALIYLKTWNEMEGTEWTMSSCPFCKRAYLVLYSRWPVHLSRFLLYQ